MPFGPAKMERFPSRCPTTNRTMSRPVTAITAFLPIESENSRIEGIPFFVDVQPPRGGDASRNGDARAERHDAVTRTGLSRSGEVRNSKEFERSPRPLLDLAPAPTRRPPL